MKYEHQEQYLEAKHNRHLIALLATRSYKLNVMRWQADEYTEVYGNVSSDPKNQEIFTIDGICISDDFIPTDGNAVGMFKEGFLYTYNNQVNINDKIIVDRKDAKIRMYQIVDKMSIGMTTTVFYKYHLSSIEHTANQNIDVTMDYNLKVANNASLHSTVENEKVNAENIENAKVFGNADATDLYI